MTDRFTHDAACYVLGALAPDERQEFERHLETCPACQAEVREFAGLPGLLTRLPVAEVQDVLGPERRPGQAEAGSGAGSGAGDEAAPTMLPTLLARARRERRSRRWRAVAIGAAAACLAALGTGIVLAGPGSNRGTPVARPTAPVTVPAPAVRAFARVVPGAPASAEASVQDVAHGTRIRMTCRYLGAVDGRYREWILQVRPKGTGAPIQLGTWPVLGVEDYGLGAVAPLPRDRIESFEVTNSGGTVLLRLTV